MTEKTLSDGGAALLSLTEINDQLRQAESLADQLALVIPRIVKFCRADRGWVLVFDFETVDFKQLVVSTLPGAEVQSTDPPPGLKSLARQAIREGRTLIGYGTPEDMPEAKTMMLVAVPLEIGSKTRAVLSLESRKPDAYPTQAFEFLAAVKTPLAQAVEIDALKAAVAQEAESRSAFISLVTHQLRVPLTSISGYADMVANGLAGPLTEKQETFLQTIRRNVERMNELIRILGEINRIDSGRKHFRLAEFRLDQVIGEMADNMQDIYSQRSQQLVAQIEPDLSPVFGDREATTRVLGHLLRNASQYAPEGTIVRISAVSHEQFATVKVTDEGIGISPADGQYLFELFFRSEDEVVRKHVGWGLGLAISKRLVEGQGGQLAFESEYGHGTTFAFTIPTAQLGTT